MGWFQKLFGRKPPPDFEVAHWLYLQPIDLVAKYAGSMETLNEYLEVLNAASKEYVESQPKAASRKLTILVAIKAGSVSRFWAFAEPGGLPPAFENELLKRLQSVRSPSLRSGAIAALVHATLWMKADAYDLYGYPRIPAESERIASEKGLHLPDDILSVIWPD